MVHNPSSTGQLEYAMHMLGTAPGVIVAALCVMLFFFSFMERGRWLVISLLLYISMFESALKDLGNGLIPPFDQIRYVAQPLTMLLLGFLLVPALFVAARRKGSGLFNPVTYFWLVEFIYGLHLAMSADLTRGTLAIVVYTIILIALGFGLPRWLRDMDDLYAAIRCIAWAGVLFAVSTTIQLLINRSAAISNDRLYAITANPQHAAVMLAVCLVPACFLLSSARENLPMRFMWGAATGLFVVLLVWTGSRTGVLAALVGLGLAFRRRIGMLLGAGVIVVCFVFAFLAAFQTAGGNAARLVSILDTRSETWGHLLADFQAEPLFGKVTSRDWGAGESSYLTIAARTGSIGLAALVIFLWSLAATLRRVGRMRAALESPDDRNLIDLAVAGLASLLTAAFFEGLLVGTLTFMLLSFYFYLGLIRFLNDLAIATTESAPLPAENSEPQETDWLANPVGQDATVNTPF